MKIKVKVPNENYTQTQFIVDRNVDFYKGKAEFEGDERHVAVLKSQKGYEVEVEEEKKPQRKTQSKSSSQKGKEDNKK